MIAMPLAFRRPTIPGAVAGLFLAVTVAGQPMHLWLAARGDADGVRSRGCAGHCAHAVGAVAADACQPSAAGWSRRHAAHDADTCGICQFFATAKAYAPNDAADPLLSPAMRVGRADALPYLPPSLAVYEARGPPSA